MDVVPVTIILENILSLNNESLLNSFDINHFFFNSNSASEPNAVLFIVTYLKKSSMSPLI